MSTAILMHIRPIVLTLAAAAWSLGLVPAVGAETSKPAAPAPQASAAPAQSAQQSAQRIDKLIRQLGNKDYYARQQAQDELAKLGFEALEASTPPQPTMIWRSLPGQNTCCA